MYRLNLFYDQQRIQRAKDLDPVRLTILGGLVAALLILLYWSLIYIRMGDLRAELDSRHKALTKLDGELKDLGTLTDLTRIQGQAQLLQERMEYRTSVATQLDILRDVVPTNCQLRVFKTQRGLQTSETITKDRKGNPVVTKTVIPTLNLLLEVENRGKDKVEVLQTRDRFLDQLRQAPRLREWAVQTTPEGSTNSLNRVDLVSSQTPDAARGTAMGVFGFRLPLALKDPPREAP